jgi:phosphatidylglycerol---prolipoprotein diacylglyceryl transferase
MEPRHPSQLYEAGLEGLVLFGVLAFLVYRHHALLRLGLISGTFLVGYGLSRIAVEILREPDTFIEALPFGTTYGQWLSVPMVIFGAYLIRRALQQPFGPGRNSRCDSARMPCGRRARRPSRCAPRG